MIRLKHIGGAEVDMTLQVDGTLKVVERSAAKRQKEHTHPREQMRGDPSGYANELVAMYEQQGFVVVETQLVPSWAIRVTKSLDAWPQVVSTLRSCRPELPQAMAIPENGHLVPGTMFSVRRSGGSDLRLIASVSGLERPEDLTWHLIMGVCLDRQVQIVRPDNDLVTDPAALVADLPGLTDAMKEPMYIHGLLRRPINLAKAFSNQVSRSTGFRL